MFLSSLLNELNSTRTVLVLILHDFQILWYLVLRFQLPDLIGTIFEDDIAFIVLKLSQAAHQQITNSYPYFLSHLASNMADPLDLV